MNGSAPLVLLHYCYPGCTPFQNIMRLPEKEAFSLAGALALAHPKTMAFYRFADFENYYPRRLKTDAALYRAFVAQGGTPKERHPLSFVLQGSAYLHDWFGQGPAFALPLEALSDAQVSFTYGDSCAQMERTGQVNLMTKGQLLQRLAQVQGDVAQLADEKGQRFAYIEAQLWDDSALRHVYAAKAQK